jgi:hypothetical protein
VTETVTNSLPLSVDFNEIDAGMSTLWGTGFGFGAVSSSNPSPDFTATEAGTHTFTYNLIGETSESIDDNSNRSYVLSVAYAVNGAGTVISTLFSGATGAVPQQDYPFNLSGSVNLALSVSDVVTFYVIYSNYSPAGPPNTDASNFRTILNTASYLNVSLPSVAADTTCESYFVHEATAQVLSGVTDLVNPLRSNYFGRTNSQPQSYAQLGCGGLLAITNGLKIRQFPYEWEAPDGTDYIYALSAKFEDIFETLNAIYNIGVGVEDDIIRMEDLEYFYDDEVIYTITNPRSVKRMTEGNFSKIEVGYSKYGFEEGTTRRNTQDAFCSRLEFNNSIENTDEEYRIVSPYIADHYSVEYTRREPFITNTTKTTKFDKDNFVLAVDPNDTTQTERDDEYNVVDGIFSPTTAMNLRISPKRNLLRHTNVINKMRRDLLFQNAELNSSLETEFDSDGCPGSFNNALLIEKADLNFNTFDNIDGVPLFYPEILEVEAPFSFSDYLFLLSSSNGKRNVYKTIQIDSPMASYKGFIEELDFKPEEGIATIKLRRKYE